MRNKLSKGSLIAGSFALLAAILACGGSDDSNTTTTATTQQGVAAAQPGVAAGGAPQPITIGAPPSSLQVPQPPTFNLTVAANAEYQIDVQGSPMDPELYLYQGDEMIEQNDDGGEGLNARLVRFLAPGSYSIRVMEHRARPMTAQVQVQQLQPLTPVGAVTVGAPLVVSIPQFPILQRPRNSRDASREVSFQVAAPGNYICDATSTGRDAQMALIQNGQLLQQDDDSGEGNNAQITRQLTPGAYTIRVWDWLYRDAQITVLCHQ